MCDDASEPLRNLELIGEAATHIPSEVREAHQEVPWRAIIGTRNRLAHGYLSIDNWIIWSVIREAVPALVPASVPALRNLLAETKKDYP